MTTSFDYQTKQRTGSTILFLDFDGVLHPDAAYRTRKGVVLSCDGHNLFEHAPLLTDLLDPYPQVQIVLSTSWVWALSFSEAKARLPVQLQAKVKGATWHSQRSDRHMWMNYTRHNQISQYVKRHLITEWIAIDDNDLGWPDVERHHLVHTNSWGGIGDTATQNELIAKIQEKL